MKNRIHSENNVIKQSKYVREAKSVLCPNDHKPRECK